ncbi:MAG: VCBS repeat-containing protein, partial [Chitinophagaceae bacterium]|nr:VCBS repeat-containing protein [Chitinophagaceae bacterium]
LFAKNQPYLRLNGVGVGASNYFLKDVNGDGKDDAVAWFSNGDWYVTPSNGTVFGVSKKYIGFTVASGTIPMMGDVNGDGKQDAICFNPADGKWQVALSVDTAFAAPVQWSIGNGVGSVDQFIADVNGDGYDDAVIYFHTGLPGYWYVGLSNGSSGFGGFSAWITGFGNSSNQRMLADMNGDRKADAVHYTKSTGNWSVALSGGSSFGTASSWKTGFGVNAERGFAYDVDRDGKADLAYYDGGEWWSSYSTGTGIGTYNHRWVINNRPATSKGNLAAPVAKLLGSMSGSITEACVVSNNGEWLCLGNNNKGATADAVAVDTWTVWGNDYTPQLPGHAGTYDSGDSTINDIQLQLIHDAGFTYIMFDITNGVNPWVDDRSKQFVQRIKKWNSSLTSGKHKMYFCVAMGNSRAATTTDAAMTIIESESQRAWDEFYQMDSGAYYKLNGKPLLVHFVETPAKSNLIVNYTGSVPHPNYNKFTIRWMYNAIYNDTIYRNAYGWPIYDQFGNPAGNEVMDVMPGFWNGANGSARAQGQLYRSQWVRVLQNDPASVWLNSFNESWEHTAVEPSWLKPGTTMDNPSMDSTWTDYQGVRMDDFYWVMTKQYNRLYMYNQLFNGSYIQEYGHDEVYKVNGCSFQYQGSMPSQAPVLLVPDGFRSSFSGVVIDASFNTVCSASHVAGPATLALEKKEGTAVKIELFPNPSQDHFNFRVSGKGASPLQMRILDMNGKVVEQFSNIVAGNLYQLGSRYAPGLYMVEISNGGEKIIRKIVKR